MNIKNIYKYKKVYNNLKNSDISQINCDKKLSHYLYEIYLDININLFYKLLLR